MVNCQGKRLLILGGARLSCEIIRAAKSMGVHTIVTDYNEVKDSPGKQICDESYMVSTIDVDAVVSLIKEKHIDGVIVGFVDSLMPYYVDICKKANVPCYCTKEQVEQFTDKAIYKSLLRKYDIPTVEEYTVEEVMSGSPEVVYPLLVKPSDSSGARGITICHSKEEVSDALQLAKDFSKAENVLVERYIDSREVTVFWLFQDGEAYLLDIGNRHVKYNQEGVIPLPVGYTYPASILPEFRVKYEEKFKKLFSNCGIANGMMFMQCKVENDACIVYDIGYRLTGSLEYTHLERIFGVSPLKMMVHFALTGEMGGEDLNQKICPEKRPYAFNVSCLAKPGTIEEIQGLEEVRSIPGVLDVVVAHEPGETITEKMKGLLAQITVRVLGVVTSKEELYPTMKKIESTISIRSTEGEEMMLPGIEQSDIEGFVWGE